MKDESMPINSESYRINTTFTLSLSEGELDFDKPATLHVEASGWVHSPSDAIWIDTLMVLDASVGEYLVLKRKSRRRTQIYRLAMQSLRRVVK